VTVYWIAYVVSGKTAMYGAIGSALALLLWAYLLGRLVIVATVLNATLWYRNRDRERPAASSGLELE
jgi:uncharacterized BrkB/YihY/UPF0761 family membrane protein